MFFVFACLFLRATILQDYDTYWTNKRVKVEGEGTCNIEVYLQPYTKPMSLKTNPHKISLEVINYINHMKTTF